MQFSYGADGIPALFSVDHAVLAKDEIGVGEEAGSDFEIEAAVLLLVDRFFAARRPIRRPCKVQVHGGREPSHDGFSGNPACFELTRFASLKWRRPVPLSQEPSIGLSRIQRGEYIVAQLAREGV